jgi:hypothetical protein
MLRLGATQVKQVAHHAPNGIPSRPPALAGRDVATPIYDVPRVYAAERGFAGVSLHFIVSVCSDVRALDGCTSPISDRHPEVRARASLEGCTAPRLAAAHGAVALRGPRFARAPQGDGQHECCSTTIWHISCPYSHHSLHHITSRFRAALGARIVSFPCADPERGAAERRKAHTGSSITLARRDAALTARGDPGATGIAPLGAPPWRFPAAGPRFNSGSVHRIHVATCPPARSQDLADWVPYLPCRGSLRRPRDATLPLRLSGSSPETPLMSENESGVA